MKTIGTDTKLIRFEINNFDEAIEQPVMEEILHDFSEFTASLLNKYNIPSDKFKLTLGSNTIDKLLNL
ncbi:MAG: hypothetical protein H0X62_15905 [Bacteroidetes bacterium]|nr:hypothetical protein [Bacteroidota bacterium]